MTLKEKGNILKELDGKIIEHCAIEEFSKESEETADWAGADPYGREGIPLNGIVSCSKQ